MNTGIGPLLALDACSSTSAQIWIPSKETLVAPFF